ncbi:MAG: aminoacyl-tRNA hydrolase [Clostridiales bacterium]|nr:aminoacyl-tRNA hydrolase [Clostridiales bacterium]
MKVIVGLGNPGKNYDMTRHNVGFMVIDKIAEAYDIRVDRLKFKALVGEGRIQREKVLLMKPQTYMNLSGESVQELLSFYKVKKEDLIVIFDDISLKLGSTRIRLKGSAGGHNGIKSLIAHLGSDEFQRIKVGIGEKPDGWDLTDYVLSRFTKDEKNALKKGIDRAQLALELMLKDGPQAAMNQTN